MEIKVIYPPAPDEEIPDRENDRLFQELIERGDNGAFTGETIVELSTSEAVDLVGVYVDSLHRITIIT